MTDLERIGQRLVTGFPGTALTPELVQVVKEYKIGNIILFRENIASADQLRTLCADLQTLIRSETSHDAFIMIDQEGGAVTRLPESCINVPGSMALAATEASARVLESAHGPDIPIAPQTVQYLAAGILGGGALCFFALLGIAMLNNKVKNKYDLPAQVRQPVIAELPKMSKKERKNNTPLIRNDHSVIAECFHILRNNVDSLLPRPDAGGYVILLTSTCPAEGKTFASANLAAAFAKAGRKVLLIDGDLRKRSLSRQLGGYGRRGLTSILLNRLQTAALPIRRIEETGISFDFLGAGPAVPNPVSLLSQPILGQMLEHLKKQYDTVIIDAPPYGILADTAILASWSDISLYLTRSGMIDKRYFPQVQKLADTGKLPNLAFIINGVNFKSASYNYYGYGYGYGYGTGSRSRRNEPETAPEDSDKQ